MRNETTTIEVFQDLFLLSENLSRSMLRDSLKKHTKSPWRHAEEKEKTVRDDVMAFERENTNDIAASGLTLWEEPNGYKLVNIIPLEARQLSVSDYNKVMNDFIERIVKPASEDSKFQMNISKQMESIADWTSQEAADALHMFSVAANKSTGSSHPSDQKRWFAFIFAAYKAQGSLDTSLLSRWLEEVEGWPPSSAGKLVVEYEFALDLLREYEKHS